MAFIGIWDCIEAYRLIAGSSQWVPGGSFKGVVLDHNVVLSHYRLFQKDLVYMIAWE
jgi:hypothetical protein